VFSLTGAARRIVDAHLTQLTSRAIFAVSLLCVLCALPGVADAAGHTPRVLTRIAAV
jgi:hypothetical protein